VAEFEAHRARLFGIAYRMLGSASDAEDIVQEAYLRWARAERAAVAVPGAWLAKVVTNLSLNELTSARVRREQYVGQWLPEPVLTATVPMTTRQVATPVTTTPTTAATAPVTGASLRPATPWTAAGGAAASGAVPPMALGPLETAEQRDSISFALLVLLERLTPSERAVFVLREAFAYPHREIAEVLQISEANSRQLYRRARHAVHGSTEPADGTTSQRTDPSSPTTAVSEDRARWLGLVETFLTAAREGDLARLEQLLAEDVVSYADGGGRTSSARRPIVGPAKVARYLVGGLTRFAAGVDLVPYEVNGGPALLALAGEQLVGVVSLESAQGRIATLRISVNPDKLEYAARQFAAYGAGCR
jgi:RNA polymerase sigma-70 factor (ECF subfamily)